MTVPAKRPAGLGVLAQLEKAGALTETSLTLPAGTSFDRWEAVLGACGHVKHVTCWLIGDALLFGEAAYGERYAQAVEITGLSPDTLANYASVCRRVPHAHRRGRPLTFGHHAEVAALEPKEQKQWLDKALANDWTRAQLRVQMRDVDGEPAGRRPNTLREAAEAVWHQAERALTAEGPAFFVPREPLLRLGAALGYADEE